MNNKYKLSMVLFFSLVFFATGCSSKRTFYFIDENGIPVKDVLVVARECEITSIFTGNRIMINKTDDKGCVKFYLDGFAHCDGGKPDYYPVSFCSSAENIFCPFISSDPFKILIRKDYGEASLYSEYDRVLRREKENKQVIKSPLWNDWFLYLRRLDEQDYFQRDNPKKKIG
ncbi:MAG: hypothetical protein A2017_00390 [Lentisphaerae bacterium GWF2_44_16]|nr:MAG: hypothetical protein A2017_00390 [Lentisphaerae bacterium GWF2_44_16]